MEDHPNGSWESKVVYYILFSLVLSLATSLVIIVGTWMGQNVFGPSLVGSLEPPKPNPCSHILDAAQRSVRLGIDQPVLEVMLEEFRQCMGPEWVEEHGPPRLEETEVDEP